MSIFGPEVDKMFEEDNRILERGKIVCEDKHSPITRRIEALATQIKDWEKRDDEMGDSYIFPWKDLALSLLKYPEHVEFDYDICPECGNGRVKLFFLFSKMDFVAFVCTISRHDNLFTL